MQIRISASLACLPVATLLASPASSQCQEWSPDFDVPGVAGTVNSQVVWDDGNGPALYAAGNFEAAGTVAANNIVRWDGATWSTLGPGILGSFAVVNDLAVYDEGAGPVLFVTGNFSSALGNQGHHITRWDGSSWSSVAGLGLSSDGNVLEVYDMGGGPVLFIGGEFQGASLKKGLAQWDGTTLTHLPSNVSGTSLLAGFDDGSGPALYVGGPLVGHEDLIRWDGTAYANLNWTFPTPTALTVWDDGSGAALYAGYPGGVVRWDGANWNPLGAGPGLPRIGDLLAYDDGSGEKLYASGVCPSTPPFCQSGSLAAWDGTTWTGFVGGGVSGSVNDLWIYDDGLGGGPALYLGGDFAAPQQRSLARYAGSSVEGVHTGSGSFDQVHAAIEFDSGDGPKLYAGIDNGDGRYRVMSLDGTEWTALGGAFDDEIRVLYEHTDGALYAGGTFGFMEGAPMEHIAKWDGTAWVDVGGGVLGSGKAHVAAMASFDFGAGPELVVAGRMNIYGSHVNVGHIGRWNGTRWEMIGSGMDEPIRALALFDDGSGTRLHAAGEFTVAGGNSTFHVARWNGATWVPLQGGTNRDVSALEVWDDGSGPALFVGGEFTLVNGIASDGVARWDGSWSVPGELAEISDALDFVVHDDGEGEFLYIAGVATASSPVAGSTVLRWDGANVSTPPDGWTNVQPNRLATFDDGVGAGASLFAFGDFTTVADHAAFRVARLARECPCPPVTYCTAKINSQGCTPSIGWSGTYPSMTQPSGFFLTTTNSLSNKSGLFFYGYTPKGSPYQGGWLCVQAPAKRTQLQNSGGVGACDGAFSFDFNARIASGVDPALSSGTTIYGQYWSRDPASSFNTIRTDAIQFVICP